MEIIHLADDEVIQKPGFYQISLERHHSQPCEGPSVTSGVLRQMELATPSDVWVTHRLNPNRVKREDTDALRLGRIMAAFIERGSEGLYDWLRVLPSAPKLSLVEMFELAKAGNEPSDKTPQRPNFDQVKRYLDGNPTPAGRASVEFWLEVEADPREKVTEAEFQNIKDMGKVLALDPAACAVMGGLPEITMAYQDDQTGLWLLSRPDTVNFDGTVTDYKKINTQGRPFNYCTVDNRITDHGYDMQLAFAAEVFESITGQWPSMAGIIAQWDAPPHHVILREISEEDLRIGQFRNRRAIARFAECLASKHWPGPGDDVGAYQRPTWQRDMLLTEMNTENQAP